MKNLLKHCLFLLLGCLISIGAAAAQREDPELHTATQKCSRGDYVSCANAAFMYSNLGEDKKSLELYQLACDHNVPDGCFGLGVAYLEGDFGNSAVKPSNQKAFEYLQKGCNLDDGNSCARLGEFYEKGIAVKPSFTVAAKLYKKACDIGTDDDEACLRPKDKDFQQALMAENNRSGLSKLSAGTNPPDSANPEENSIIQMVRSGVFSSVDDSIQVGDALENYAFCVKGTQGYRTFTTNKGALQVVFSCRYEYQRAAASLGFGPSMSSFYDPAKLIRESSLKHPKVFNKHFEKKTVEMFETLDSSKTYLEVFFTISRTNERAFRATQVSFRFDGDKGALTLPAKRTEKPQDIVSLLQNIYQDRPLVTSSVFLSEVYHLHPLAYVDLLGAGALLNIRK